MGFFGYDLVRTVEPLGEPRAGRTDPLGLPDMALMLSDALVVFDHLKHTVTILANADLQAEPDIERAYEQAARTIAEVRGALAGPVPRGRRRTHAPASASCPTFESNMPREQFEAMVARIVEYIYAGDAFQVVPSQRWSARGAGRGVLDLPRPARGQPEPLHVLPGLRRLPGRRREPRAAADGQRTPRQHEADRRNPPARREPRGGPPDRRRSCWPTRRSAPST